MDFEKDIEKSIQYKNVDECIKDIKEPDLIEDTRAKTSMVDSEKLIEQRKKRVLNFLKSKQMWVVGFLIIAIILGVYIRSMPMHDHGGNPGLWDIATNDWTLGPDLDPWLFTRYAQTIVEQGSLPEIDMMRNVPLGFDTSKETMLLPNMIVWTYYLVNLFGDYPIEFAAAIFPVIMFALTIISFFLFVREIFIRKSIESTRKANLISIISTFFLIVIPVFLSRTVAGIPEKESAGFFFMFLVFYLFLKAWKSEDLKKASIFAILAGIATTLMRLIWGGALYVYIIIALATSITFILNKINKKEFITYLSWAITSFSLTLIFFSNKVSIKELLTALDTGLATFIGIILIIHFILWKTKLSKNELLNKIKIPKNISSLIIGIILILILASLVFGLDFIPNKIKMVNKAIFQPTTGRWNTTVAENRQPYFTEWVKNFGPYLKKIPILFWLFFAGSVVLFKKMLKYLKKKDSIVLTFLYIFFFFGLVFSRYSSSSLFNGDNFISKAFYFISAFLFIGYFVYYYIKYYKEKNDAFYKVEFEYLFLFSILFFTLFTVRGAVRLIMVLGPIAPIFASYLIIESISKFKKINDETMKIILGLVVIILLLLVAFSFFSFYKTTKNQAYNFIPSGYNQQWQKAMDWVRQETPTDAVFSHWWDYGYWVQSIGNRATVLDGGNAKVYWNYLMGRHVLTGDNQNDALEFLYNHDTDYLLIDSTDIGKYGAFSSIGSNENHDRFSWVATFVLDESQTQETNNQTIFVYPGGASLDEDLIINENGQELLFPQQNAGVGAIIIPYEKDRVAQPYIIIFYQGRQHNVYLRYVFVEDQVIDFESGIEAGVFLFPRLVNTNGGLSTNPIGAAMYLSPRLLRGMLVQKYILNDPFNKFPNFKLVHSQESLIVESLNQQAANLPSFIYYGGVQGPIKIWEIQYSGNEQLKEEYTDTDPTKYLTWEL